MRFMTTISNVEVIMTPDTLEALINLLANTHRIEDKWVGSGKGEDGSNYIKLVRAFQTKDIVLKVMSDSDYEGRVALTAIHDADPS